VATPAVVLVARDVAHDDMEGQAEDLNPEIDGIAGEA
jgi:hypothetical protein